MGNIAALGVAHARAHSPTAPGRIGPHHYASDSEIAARAVPISQPPCRTGVRQGGMHKVWVNPTTSVVAAVADVDAVPAPTPAGQHVVPAPAAVIVIVGVAVREEAEAVAEEVTMVEMTEMPEVGAGETGSADEVATTTPVAAATAPVAAATAHVAATATHVAAAATAHVAAAAATAVATTTSSASARRGVRRDRHAAQRQCGCKGQ